MKIKIALILSLTAISMVMLASNASADKGGSSGMGGGGDVIILPDDTVILADPFIRRNGQNFDLAPELIVEIRRAGVFMSRYGAASKDSFHSTFVENDVLNPLTEYRFTNDLPANCHRITVGDLPAGSTDEWEACTIGSVSWFRESLFKRMSVREQAKLILHERFRSIPANPSDQDIADLTDGLASMLLVYNREINGTHPALSKTEISSIELFRKRIIILGLTSAISPAERRALYDAWTVNQNGGGLVSVNASVATSAYIGVGSVVLAGSILGEHSSLTGAVYCGHCKLGAFAQINSSQVWGETLLEENAVIENSIITDRLTLGKNAQVKKSKIWMLTAGANSIIENTTTGDRLTLGINSFIQHVTVSDCIRGSIITLKSNSSLKNIHWECRTLAQWQNATFDNEFIRMTLHEDSSLIGPITGNFVPISSTFDHKADLEISQGMTIDLTNENPCDGKNIKIIGLMNLRKATQFQNFCE